MSNALALRHTGSHNVLTVDRVYKGELVETFNELNELDDPEKLCTDFKIEIVKVSEKFI